MNPRIRLVGVAAVFGLAMHGAAELSAEPGWGWLQWVVNWGALWVVVPFLVGRRSERASAAAVFGAIAGATEVAVYYGPADPAAFKVAWLAAGAIVSAGVGAFGASVRSRRSLLAVPSLLILEPLAVTTLFLMLGRHLGPHWFASYSAELSVGFVLCAVVLQTGRRSSADLEHGSVT